MARLFSRRGAAQRQGLAGWVFVAPILILLGIFLFVPIIMAVWVSLSDWSGNGSPFSQGVNFVGTKNFADVLTGGGLTARDFGTSVRNNLYYVLLVVPLQTLAAMVLAVLVSRRNMKGRSAFRMAFYFPSVTSSVAITVLWMYLFSATGAINEILSWFSITGPNWFQDPRGVLGLLLNALGVHGGGAMSRPGFLGISAMDWLSGPSVAMCALILMAIFATIGVFMLMFIAALQNIGAETEEAALVDGANAWQRFWYITVPLLRPTIYTVVTLGTIGCWQVFDQIYTGTQGGPAKTTITPAYLSYSTAMGPDQNWGKGAAIAFILFAIILVFGLVQRMLLGQADPSEMSRADRRRQRRAEGTKAAALGLGTSNGGIQ